MESRPMPCSTAFCRRVKFLAPLVLSFSLHASQQTNTPAPAAATAAAANAQPQLNPGASQYSQEPVVVEDLIVKVRFESDGRGTIERTIRERIQTDSAVTSEGLLPFAYDSGDQTLDIKYVRVRKPDGSVVETPVDSAQDVTAEIARNAPMYTDLHEKHVAVRGLSVGDVLETRYVVTTTKPFAEGQFWSSYSFEKNAITLHEQLDIDVPADRAVKLHASLVKPTISDAAGRRVYSFQHAVLSKPAEPDKFQAAVDGVPYPDVELSSFTSWDQVAAWYGALQKPRVQVTPELQAKALELTRDKKTEDEKIHALYDYVSLKFRYIGISFGVGRYQPHASPDVLANGFGDCKDKHTLFAALLQAIDVNSYPVLIHSSIKLDPAVPTPAVFDHLITAIPKGDKFTWLDTTPGVAPFAALMEPLRGKLALVVMDGKGVVARTPNEWPFPVYEHFTMDASVTKEGVLDGNARLESRGDGEIIMRLAFRNTPQSRWNELTEAIIHAIGFAGTVDDVASSPLDDTSKPFWITYKYHRADYGDWPNHQITLPLPYFLNAPLSPEEEKTIGAIPLGELKEVTYEARLTLPAAFVPVVPESIHSGSSFMAYDASYKLSGSVLEGKRRLSVLQPNVAPGDRHIYTAFNKIITDDEGRWIALTTDALPPRYQSSNPDVQKLLAEAYRSLQVGAPHAASTALEKAVKIDPKSANSWFMLGYARSTEHQYELAIVAFKKDVELNPSDEEAYACLASLYRSHGKESEVVQAWRDYLEIVPDDEKASRSLASTLVLYEDYAAARPVLEKLTERGTQPPVTYELAETYLHVGEQEKGMKLLQEMVDANADADNLNAAAWALAEAKYNLPDALKYADQSVRETEEQTSREPGRLRALMYNLDARWDTLGWVYFQMGKLDAAERYLTAAWKLGPTAEVGSHLGDVYAKKGDNARAMHMYALALASLNSNQFGPQRDKLMAKTKSAGSNSQFQQQLQDRRSFTVKYAVDSETSANFLLILGKDPKSKQINLVSGDDSLRKLIPMISALKLDLEFPDDGPTRLYQSATLHCSQLRHDCSFVLFEPPQKEMSQVLQSQASNDNN
jgi:tetratricopeptide (TPR) repeat protein